MLKKNSTHLHKYQEKRLDIIPYFFKSAKIDCEKFTDIIEDYDIQKQIGLLAAKYGLFFHKSAHPTYEN